MNDDQKAAIRCAHADLIGAWQDWAQQGCGDSFHDWAAHKRSIIELQQAFPDVLEPFYFDEDTEA